MKKQELIQLIENTVRKILKEDNVQTDETRSIEIDCPPGSPRPGDLFPGVLEKTGLTEDDFVNTSRLMGEWIWALKKDNEKAELFDKAKPMFKDVITKLYNSGKIRYGSW